MVLGLQVCATIDNLSQIKDLTKKEATSLVLSAAWCPGDIFEFSIIYPSEGEVSGLSFFPLSYLLLTCSRSNLARVLAQAH